MSRGRRALAKQVSEARHGREDDAEVEEIEDFSGNVYESQMKRTNFKKQQKVYS